MGCELYYFMNYIIYFLYYLKYPAQQDLKSYNYSTGFTFVMCNKIEQYFLIIKKVTSFK